MKTTVLLVSLFAALPQAFATSLFSCHDRQSTADKTVALVEIGANDETLEFKNVATGFQLSAKLDEPESSSYFYTANQDGIDYTVVVSTQLFEAGEGTLSVEIDGDPIPDGSLFCKSSGR